MTEEIPPMVDQIRFFAGAARVLEGKSAGEYMRGFTSFIRREPIGVCAAVTPWNYPVMMAVWKWAPALAAGNTMVLKPSDTTPASTRLDGRGDGRVPARRACSTSSAATATPAPRWSRHPTPADGLDHRQRARRHGGRQGGGRRRQARAPRARRQGAGDRVRRRRRRARPPRTSRSPATSTPARTARRPRACSPARASTTTSSPRSTSRRKGTQAPARRTTARSSTAR